MSATPYPQNSSGAASTTTPSSGGAADPAVSRIVQSAHDAVDRVAEKATPAVERARASLDDATQALRQRRQQLGDMQTELAASARENVRAHPLTAVLTAFAAGLVISRILR